MSDGQWKLTKKQVRIIGPGIEGAIYRVTNEGPSAVNIGLKDMDSGLFTYLETKPGCSMDVPISGGELWIYPMGEGGTASGGYALVR